MNNHVPSVLTATGVTSVPKATATWDERKHRMCSLCGVSVRRLKRAEPLIEAAIAVQQLGKIIGNRCSVPQHDKALLDFTDRLAKLKSLDASSLNRKQDKALQLVISKADALHALYPTA